MFWISKQDKPPMLLKKSFHSLVCDEIPAVCTRDSKMVPYVIDFQENERLTWTFIGVRSHCVALLSAEKFDSQDSFPILILRVGQKWYCPRPEVKNGRAKQLPLFIEGSCWLEVIRDSLKSPLLETQPIWDQLIPSYSNRHLDSKTPFQKWHRLLAITLV